MTFTLFLSLLSAMFGFASAEQSDQVRTLTVEQEVIMRIPVRPRSVAAASPGKRRKGRNALRPATSAGAALSGRETVDFFMFDRTRLRAELDEDCPALDFYNGFYVHARRRQALRETRRNPFPDGPKLQDRAFPQA